ncbi:hypothetical protein EJ02DRAFT_470433 [Clathrospora elynae]|uniref:Uncharacterized protein n=1 Tax=Clathrospora elynae TaxID=706981 RepID=A0A6A5S8U6_9PLEO|nr:hypothetical protein EJ02DRAFT_470433 [Clathrospora elynae]
MAPQPLHRRATNLTLTGNIAIIILVILFVAGVFCTVIFFKLCSKQRRSEKAMRRMQEQQTPFIGNQYVPPPNAHSQNVGNENRGNGFGGMQNENGEVYRYDGPLELQGSGRPEAQQLDGDAAVPTFDHGRPIELPSTAVVNHGGLRSKTQN